MTKIEKIKETVVNYEEFTSLGFIPPAAFYFRNAVGDYIFLHTQSHAKAQAHIDAEWGSKYTAQRSKLEGNNGKTLTATGTQTRRGQKK